MHIRSEAPARQITCNELPKPEAHACCIKNMADKALLTPQVPQPAAGALMPRQRMPLHLSSSHRLSCAIAARSTRRLLAKDSQT